MATANSQGETVLRRLSPVPAFVQGADFRRKLDLLRLIVRSQSRRPGSLGSAPDATETRGTGIVKASMVRLPERPFNVRQSFEKRARAARLRSRPLT